MEGLGGLQQHATVATTHPPVFRQPPGNQALNDIAVIPEYYPSWIPGGGKTGLRCLKQVRPKPSKGTYAEGI